MLKIVKQKLSTDIYTDISNSRDKEACASLLKLIDGQFIGNSGIYYYQTQKGLYRFEIDNTRNCVFGKKLNGIPFTFNFKKSIFNHLEIVKFKYI